MAPSTNLEPFDNPPVRHPNGFMERLRCEVRVYSNDRSDIGGHQCGNLARWRIAAFDEHGDIVVCGRHRDGGWGRSTHLSSIFGHVAGQPTSVRKPAR
jgi:hypothetical protein